jgi:hypothetical protein
VNARLGVVTAFVAVMVCAVDAYPCKTTRSVSNVDMVREADAIVRATAEDYAPAPSNPGSREGFEPDSRVRFKVLEVVRGKMPKDHLVLPGVLVDADDFNDHAPPYTLVRPDGRRVSCSAISYRSGGQFLLMLKKRNDGVFTVNWYALAPVNEQLHSADDPWLLWVRKQAKDSNSKSLYHQ